MSVDPLSGGDAAVVFATVGTDHHRFNRLIAWIDRWLARRGEEPVSCFVQRGTSMPPRLAASADYLGYEEMQRAMRRAVAVVSHGGPASIMLCCYCGKKPIVVPRQSSAGEHVDDHQVLFSRRLAAEGEILLAENEDRFGELLDRALAGIEWQRPAHVSDQGAGAVQRFEQLMDDLLSPR